MPQRSHSEIIRACYGAFISKDRKVVEDILADDFTFTSPYDDAIDKATYFERCWPNSELFESFDIERIFEKGSEAFVLYRVVTKDGKEFRNTEFLTFDGGKIAGVNVYFGPAYRDGAFVREQ
jgi:ketosteroid isomerase-like protein